MKINLYYPRRRVERPKDDTFLLLKLTSLILFVASLQVSAANGYPRKKTSLHLNSADFTGIFEIHEKPSDYRPPYSNVTPNGIPAVNLLVREVDTTITGRVIDSKTGAPLTGVTIQVKGTTLGTVTDAQGRFKLSVPDNATLIVTSVGYQTRNVEVKNETNFTIHLDASATGLNQLVVVGYGTQKRVNLTGAVATASVSTLKQAPVTNFSNTLAGRLPGIISITGSGEPGEDGSSILIRGDHSINNNSPLIVIDGVPQQSDALDRLDPNDIASISVLKDATASIYGSEAANGVILITTKQGKKDQPAEVNLTFNQGYSQPTRIPKMANAPTYMTMLNEASLYDGTPMQFTQADIDAYKNPNRNPWLYPNTNWFKAALKPLSPQTNGNLSVSGGTNRLTYFLSLGAQTEEGFYKKSATRYNQFNVRSNFSEQITKDIKLTFNLSGREEDRNFPTVSAGQTFRMIIRGRPTDPAYYPNGLPGPDQENGVQPVVTGTTQTGFHRNVSYFARGDLGLDIKIPGLTGFDLKGLVSWNKEFQTIKNWQKPWTLYTFDKQAYINNGEKDPESFLNAALRGPTAPNLTQSEYDQVKTLENLVANYHRSFGVNNISVMVGTELQRFSYNTFQAYREQFISASLPELFAGSEQNWSNNGSGGHGARMSYFGRVDYNYKEKYLFEFVGREDGSYLFPPDKRFGFFPAFSGGWRLSEEPFFKNNINLFDDLKLRASWGITGNDITDPTALVEDPQYLGGYGFTGGYVLGINQVEPTLDLTRVPNPNVTWERAKQLDIGIDGTALKNRLSFTIDYWNEMRSGILIQKNASVPQTTGLTLPRENLGKVRSWGEDGSIGWNQRVSNKLSFNALLNLGYSNNKIVFWDEPPGAPAYQRSTGDKIGTSLYYDVIGVFQNEKQVDAYPHWPGARPGDLIFKDVNGDGKIDANDMIRVNKNSVPDWTGGITLGAKWKQLSASVFFQGAAGAVLWVSTESGDIGNYFEQFAEKRWRPDPSDPTGMTPAPGAPFSGPRTFDRGDTYWSPQGSNASTYFLRSTNYIRLKTLDIGYNFSPHLLSRLGGIHSLRVYVNGYNLITWDKLKVMDPEASNSAGDYYPQTRIYNVGFNLTF